MVAEDENALICDFAETYHIFDYKQMPLKQAAILAHGLPNDSRIKLRLSGRKYGLDTLLIATVADALNTLVWFQTEDGQKHRNRPQSIARLLTEEPADELEEFDSIEAYEAARKQRMEN